MDPPTGQQKPAPVPKSHAHPGCADVKPRLTKEQHDILENHFTHNPKPTTSFKKGIADTLGVPLDKINNWFQNRRAKVKQDIKKQQNAYNMNMNMNMYNAPHMSMVVPQFAPPTEPVQPPPQPMAQHPHQHQHQQYFPTGADISPSHLPTESIEVPSSLEQLGTQAALHQPPMDMHLQSIPETHNAAAFTDPSAVFQSFLAAAAGPYMPQTESYDFNGLPQLTFSDQGFASGPAPTNDVLNGFGDFSGFDYSSLPATTAVSAPMHDSTGSISSEASPLSRAQSTATPQSSSAGTGVTSITSIYTGYTEEPKPIVGASTPGNPCDDPLDQPYLLPQASVSDQTLQYWELNGQRQPFPQGEIYRHQNASAQAILSSPPETHELSTPRGDSEDPAQFADGAYSRRNSSTTNLANTIDSIHLQNGQNSDGFKQPVQPSSIASRRHKHPAALNPNTLRSSSYSAGMPSPGANPEHALRRIRSSGLPNAGRIQKPTPGSAQRSPLTLTFAEAAASPKFARTLSSSTSMQTMQGGAFAPPTPQTPNGVPRMGSWQGMAVFRTHQPVLENDSPESLNVSWPSETHPNGAMYPTKASPPSTPLDLQQLPQAPFANGTIYRDTPPQSAPATQQTFPASTYMSPPPIPVGFRSGSTNDLTILQPKPSHFKRPSLPENGHFTVEEPQMQYPVQYTNAGDAHINYEHQFKEPGFNGFQSMYQFPPAQNMSDLFIQEYAPPGHGPAGMVRRPPEPQQKNYIFANQGPHDFKSA